MERPERNLGARAPLRQVICALSPADLLERVGMAEPQTEAETQAVLDRAIEVVLKKEGGSGYRDVNMNLAFRGHICELQLQLVQHGSHLRTVDIGQGLGECGTAGG